MMARKRKIITPVIKEVPDNIKISPKKTDNKITFKKSPVPMAIAKTIKQYAKIPIKKKKHLLPKINSESEGEENGEKKASAFTKYQVPKPVVEDFESLSKEIDYDQKGKIFDTALGSSNVSPKRCLKFQADTDELYHFRMLP